ncbi:transglutaminase family protein [Phenylobacterium sp. J367]|uniref:transglutaminase family protein n=1 Tax=Phenylobacterium sp. J367 TaxID=2898435 RepID=UPI002150C557|nr:transglutaminase family protein [Phenylobacterium sp. J367]MCR5880052.1 transglutaminase family protein [Phenylobacterium sp. J367]
MLLEVRHVTQYQYEEPVRESVMELWMQPQRGANQRLVSFELELDPPAKVFSYADAFGNAVYHFDVPQPHDRLTITAVSAVETHAPAHLPETLDTGEWDRLRSDFVRGDNFEFLHAHGFARETEMLHAFVEEHDLNRLRAACPLTAVRTLSSEIYRAFDYEAGVTRADSPIDDVLQHKKGVCQDFAHVMIAICRSWGIPARYVSGYLFTDRKQGDRSDPDATHAWVEVFLPSTRWIGFDPTNNIPAGERHVPLRGRPGLFRRAAVERRLQGRGREPARRRRQRPPGARRTRRA